MNELREDDVYHLRLLPEIDVSPTGDRVAFGVHEFLRDREERYKSIFVVPTDGSEPPHRVTRAAQAWSPKWGPNGRRLAFLSTRDPDPEIRRRASNDGEDDVNGEDRPQVWVTDLRRGGDARQITDRTEGVTEFDWGSNGGRMVVAAPDPTDEQLDYRRHRRDENGPIVTERLQHKYMGHGWLDDVTTYLFVVDLETREETRLDRAYGAGAREPETGLNPAWNPTEDVIAFVSNRTERPDDSFVMDVYTISTDGNCLRKLTDGGITASALRWSPDGRRLAFVGNDPENWYLPSEVFVGVPDEGTTRSVSESLDRPVSPYAQTVAWLDGSTVVAPIGDDGRTRLAVCSPETDSLRRVFDSQGDSRSIESFDANGDQVCVTLSKPDTGQELFAIAGPDLVDRESQASPRQLTEQNRELTESFRQPSHRWLTFENTDGDSIEAIAYCPPDFDPSDDRSYPLHAVVHGGPITYDAPIFDFDATYWTSRGYVVLKVNYRGSSSYGTAFSETIRGEWGPKEADDVISGVTELVDRGWADPDRLFVSGFSQGAVITLYVLTRTDIFAGAAAEHGIYDFYSAFGTCDIHKWYEHDLGLPWENPDRYRAISSITDVDDLNTPLLITAGGEDWRCPPSQAEELYVAAQKVGVPTRLVVYPEEHHSPLGPPDRVVHRLEQLTEWFEEYDPSSG